jgi:hypothetical protein
MVLKRRQKCYEVWLTSMVLLFCHHQSWDGNLVGTVMESATKGRFKAEHPNQKLEVGLGNTHEWGAFGELLGNFFKESVESQG